MSEVSALGNRGGEVRIGRGQLGLFGVCCNQYKDANHDIHDQDFVGTNLKALFV